MRGHGRLCPCCPGPADAEIRTILGENIGRIGSCLKPGAVSRRRPRPVPGGPRPRRRAVRAG